MKLFCLENKLDLRMLRTLFTEMKSKMYLCICVCVILRLFVKDNRSQCSSRQIEELQVTITLKKDLNPRPRPFDIPLDILGKHQISWSKGEKRTIVYIREMPMMPACNVRMQYIWKHSTVTDTKR